MVKLTVVIPTLNEEQDLPRTLRSIKKLEADILVVDSGSTDSTVKIAKDHGAKVVNHPFKSFSDTRNFANLQIKSGWILSLEADVVITKELAQEITASICKTDAFTAYYIPRQNIIWGREIKYTDWGPKDDLHIWLYQKNTGSWQGKVHEEYGLEKGISGKLKNPLIHHNYQTVEEFIDKINRYSKVASQDHSFPFYWPLRDFFKRYFYKLGFLDGYHGLFLSYLQAVYYSTLKIKSIERSYV